LLLFLITFTVIAAAQAMLRRLAARGIRVLNRRASAQGEKTSPFCLVFYRDHDGLACFGRDPVDPRVALASRHVAALFTQ